MESEEYRTSLYSVHCVNKTEISPDYRIKSRVGWTRLHITFMKKGCVRVRNIMRVVQTIDLKTHHFRSYDVTIQTVENFYFE